jgi:hypothetical protein
MLAAFEARPAQQTLKDGDNLRWTFRSERDLVVTQLSSVQIKSNIVNSSCAFCFSITYDDRSTLSLRRSRGKQVRMPCNLLRYIDCEVRSSTSEAAACADTLFVPPMMPPEDNSSQSPSQKECSVYMQDYTSAFSAPAPSSMPNDQI